MLITIAQTVSQPSIHIADGSSATLRGFYSQRFLDSDNETVVMSGDGVSGFYYEVPCSINEAGELVIPELQIHTTDDALDVKTSLFVGQLFIEGSPNRIIFGQPQAVGGWIIPSSLAPETSWGQLDIFNQGRALLALNVYTYLTAAESAILIRALIAQLALQGSLTTNSIPRATGDLTLEDGLATDDGLNFNVQTFGWVQFGDFGAEQNGSFLSVNDSFTAEGGRTNLYAGGSDQVEYAGVSADCSSGTGEINLQSTGITNLYGANQITIIGDGKSEQNGTQVVVSDPTRMVVQTVANQTPNDPGINNEQACFYLDQSADKLMVRVRYSDGTYKTGEITLV